MIPPVLQVGYLSLWVWVISFSGGRGPSKLQSDAPQSMQFIKLTSTRFLTYSCSSGLIRFCNASSIMPICSTVGLAEVTASGCCMGLNLNCLHMRSRISHFLWAWSLETCGSQTDSDLWKKVGYYQTKQQPKV